MAEDMRSELQGKLERFLSRPTRERTIEDARSVFESMVACLRSDLPDDINAGMYAAAMLSAENELDRGLTDDALRALVHRVPELLSSKAKIVAVQAIDLYAWLRRFYPDFRQRMLQFLSSEDEAYRTTALFHYDEYCLPGEVEPLLRFEHDRLAGDTSMAAPWIYSLRNEALEQIEKQLNRKFPSQIRTEAYLGTTISWRDWGPFLSWYRSR